MPRRGGGGGGGAGWLGTGGGGRADATLAGVCVVLALIGLALPRAWSYQVAAALRGSVLRPLVALQARATRDRTARSMLDDIEHSRDSLAELVLHQSALARENEQLRNLLGVRARLHQPVVPAGVLHRPAATDPRMLLLDVGSGSGVREFDPVVTAAGLIGYVVSVAPHSSSALTWSNPDFAASAITVDGSVTGFVHPAPDATRVGLATLELDGIALRDSLHVGTVLVTAGAGGTFPRGIPIGRVVAVSRVVNGYERIYRVVPFATPGGTGHVIVLIAPRDAIYSASPARAMLPRDSSESR